MLCLLCAGVSCRTTTASMMQAGASSRKVRADQITRRSTSGAGSQLPDGSSMAQPAGAAGKPAVVLRRSSSSTSTEGSLTLDNKASETCGEMTVDSASGVQRCSPVQNGSSIEPVWQGGIKRHHTCCATCMHAQRLAPLCFVHGNWLLWLQERVMSLKGW